MEKHRVATTKGKQAAPGTKSVICQNGSFGSVDQCHTFISNIVDVHYLDQADKVMRPTANGPEVHPALGQACYLLFNDLRFTLRLSSMPHQDSCTLADLVIFDSKVFSF